MERIAQLVAANRLYAEKLWETAIDIEVALGAEETEKVADVAGRKWTVLGLRRMGAAQAGGEQWCKRPCAVLQDRTDPDADTKAVWATKGLENIPDRCTDLFESKTDT